MGPLPEKPAGSSFVESVDAEGVTLSWPSPAGDIGSCTGAAFLACWLCAWAYGWVYAVGQLLGGGANLFLIDWLGAWTVGGGWAIWMLWAMLRPTRPESLRLEHNTLRYTPGRSPINPWQRQGWWGWGWGPPAPKPTPAAVIPRAEIRGFVLDRVGERQRLCFDRGADRLEIGVSLREPEREWLYAVLQRWHGAAG